MTRRLTLAAALLMATAPAAVALPGDTPVTAVAPETGAAVTADAAGIAVTYACPVYRQSDLGTGFVVFGGISSYGAALATSPDTGTDNRLLTTNVVALGTASADNDLPAGTCRTRLGTGRSDGPEVTPGTYYWQAYRICTGCGAYEVTEVRRVVVRSAGALTVLPAVAYAGYPAQFAVRATGLPDGVEVRLQRQAGTVWTTIATATTLKERVELVANLRRGTNRLRAVAATGAETLTSPVVAIRGREAARRATSAADDGRYAGPPGRGVKLRVLGGGRTVRGASIRVLMVCPTVTAPGSIGGQIITQTGFAVITSAPIAPDGRFIAAGARQGSSVSIRGRVLGGRVTGGIAKLSIGTCSGTVAFTATRAR